MFRTRRMQRYVDLKRVGFRPFEARSLSRVPKNTPYLKELKRERLGEFKTCKQEGISLPKYKAIIREKYISNKWLGKDKAGRPFADPWQYLRDFEERWRAKYPQYESPWEGRRKRWTDFLAGIERTIDEGRHGGRREYLEPQQ